VHGKKTVDSAGLLMEVARHSGTICFLIGQTQQCPAYTAVCRHKIRPVRSSCAHRQDGRGEVYRARDTKLMREVAIKILPATLAQRPDRLARHILQAVGRTAKRAR